jgi:cytochrome P450 family 110
MPTVTASSDARAHAEPDRTAHVDGLPPGPSTPSVVQTYRYMRAPLPLLDECGRRFGEMFTLRLLGSPPWIFVWSPPLLKALFTAPPDVVHAGEANATIFGAITGDASVFTMDESAHLDRRRLLLPQFHGDRMQVYFDQIREIAERAAAGWTPGVPFAMNGQTQQMTLHAIIRAVFGIQINRGDAADRALVEALTDLANGAVGSPLLLARPLQRDWGAWSPWGRVVRIIRRADDAIYREIARRRAAADVADRQDILSLLLQVRYEDGAALTDREVRDELVVMLMAGHETTGTALAWAFERILSLPAVERRIRAELDAVVGGGPLAAGHLSRLEYLDAVVKESLRNRPIMPAGGARLARRVFEIGGYAIPAGAILVNAMYLLHRRPELYPEPDAFAPERFMGRRTIDPYEWTPFGGGMRRCLGYAFALFEMKTILATVLSQVRLRIENADAAVVRRGFFLAPALGPRVTRLS